MVNGITRLQSRFIADTPHLEQIDSTAKLDGGTYSSLITAIIFSDLVRMTRTEPLASE